MLRFFIALAISLLSLTSNAQEGYSLKGSADANFNETLLQNSESCKNWIGKNKKSYAQVIKACNGSGSDDDKYNCFENASVCLQVDNEKCMLTKPLHDAVGCYFDLYTGLQSTGGGTVESVGGTGNGTAGK